MLSLDIFSQHNYYSINNFAFLCTYCFMHLSSVVQLKCFPYFINLFCLVVLLNSYDLLCLLFFRMVIRPLDGQILWHILCCLYCWLPYNTYLSKLCSHHRSVISKLQISLFKFFLTSWTKPCWPDGFSYQQATILFYTLNWLC